jgi:hypothetical protein
MFLTCIWKAPSLNLGWAYPECSFYGFAQSLKKFTEQVDSDGSVSDLYLGCAILTEVFCDFTLSFQANAVIIP